MVTRKWTELASLPSAAAGNHSGVASDGKYVYGVAGQTGDTYGVGTNTTWRYDIAANKWSKYVNLPEVRFGGAAFIDNGFLHFVGGCKADRKTPTGDHWAISLSNPSAGWQRRASLPVAQDHISHATVDGKVYIVGGEHGHAGLGSAAGATYSQHKYTFQYDPKANSWKRMADMPIASSHLRAPPSLSTARSLLSVGSSRAVTATRRGPRLRLHRQLLADACHHLPQVRRRPDRRVLERQDLHDGWRQPPLHRPLGRLRGHPEVRLGEPRSL